MAKDLRIDTYILKSHDFAKPILIHFRELIHKICPEVDEKIKWGMPHFDYLDAPMAHMAAFKKHCAIGFWKAALMNDAKKLTDMAKSESAMGHLGKITRLKVLPSDAILKKYIRNAMALNEKGIKASKKPGPAEVVVPTLPDDFNKVLKKTKGATIAFNKMTPGNKKDYIVWITEAKTEPTRIKRIATAVEWIAEGKNINWKYQTKS